MTQDASTEPSLAIPRPSKLWRQMTPERRLAAAQAFWTDEHSRDQQLEAITVIAKHMNFRPKSVQGLPLERRARYLASLPTISETIALRALIAYHLDAQRPMMGAFLDALGIAHENGLITEETVKAPPAERLGAAVASLASKYPREEVDLYFQTLLVQDSETWAGLAKVVEEHRI